MSTAAMIAGQAAVQILGAQMQRKENAKLAEANAQSANAQQTEITRQEGEVNLQASEARSDRMRQADAALARARSAAAEGFGNLTREVGELGYLEGLDLGRIEHNRQGQIDALEAQKSGVLMNTQFQNESLKRQNDNAFTVALLNTAGSGVQIYSRDKYYQAAEQRAKNKTGLQLGDS